MPLYWPAAAAAWHKNPECPNPDTAAWSRPLSRITPSPELRRGRADPVTDAPPQPAVSGDFFARYRPRDARYRTKHAILRETLIAAIQDGHWQAGDRLPTELELARLTPYSLGTVQRALQALVTEGFVTRKQGLGTFVLPGTRRIGGPWLFRFLTLDQTDFATMATRVVGRKTVRSSAAWATWLAMGAEEKTLLEIARLVHVEGRAVFNRFYVDPERFPELASRPLRSLHGANFAGLIQDAYNLPITHVARTVQCVPLPDAACRAAGLAAGSYGLALEIAASAGRARPVFFQQLFVPANAGKIFISDAFDRWIGADPEGAAPRQ